MKNMCILAIVLACSFLYARAASSVCSRGEMLHSTRERLAECILCDSGTFMPEDSHSHTACKSCTYIENPDVEVFVSLCNKTHDSVILCKDGFYRRRARNDRQKDRCEECTHCPNPTRACQGYHDTVCCHPNQDAVMTPSGVFVCEERPVVCGPGQFFSTSTEECLTCPAGTFMSPHKHINKECLKCEQLSENIAAHAIITRPCSRTAPTLFGCEDGYFRDPTQESLQTEVPCTPCQSCDRRLIDCGMFHDAICDRKGNNAAIESSGSEDENQHGKVSLEISTKNDNKALGAVENTSQSNKIDTGLPSCIECLETRNVWFCVLIFAILLLLSNLILLFILFRLRLDNSKADNILFHFKQNHKKHLFGMSALGVISIFVLVVAMITLAVKKTMERQELVAVSTAVILSTLVNLSYIIIYCICLNVIKTNIKCLLDDVKMKKAESNLLVTGNRTNIKCLLDDVKMEKAESSLLVTGNKQHHKVRQEEQPVAESRMSTQIACAVLENIHLKRNVHVPESEQLRQEKQPVIDICKPPHYVTKNEHVKIRFLMPESKQLHHEEQPAIDLEISAKPPHAVSQNKHLKRSFSLPESQQLHNV